MKIKVQLIVCAEDGREEQVQEVAVLEKPHQQIAHLGLTLAEAKAALKTLQQQLVERQATAFVAAHAQCANLVTILWLFVSFGEQGMGLLPTTLGLGSNWTCWKLLRHLVPLYPAPAAWRLSQFAPRVTKSDDEPILFTSVRIEADCSGSR